MKSEMKQEVEETAELVVRRYFDHFLEETLPTILCAHEKVCDTRRLVRRTLWIGLGVLIGLALAFPEILKFIAMLR